MALAPAGDRQNAGARVVVARQAGKLISMIDVRFLPFK